MKKNILLAGSILLLATTACKKKQINNVEDTMTDGNWKITYFVHDGTNKTHQYVSETFVFNANGTVTATGTQTVNGTWSVDKESGDDDLFDDKHLELYLTFGQPYGDLTESWHIESRSDSKITLKDDDDNDDDDSEDYLTLEKI